VDIFHELPHFDTNYSDPTAEITEHDFTTLLDDLSTDLTTHATI